MQKSTFSFIVILFFCIFNFVSSFPFEKKLWIFWHDDDFSKAPLLAQLCAEKLKISAEKAGFEFILLNQHTVKNYIDNYDERITKVRERSYQKGLMFMADLIRFHIIHEHGGIWMDITEILIDDFNWLLNISDDKYKHLIANRFSDEPDVLLFYFEGYQNAAQYYVESPTKKGEMILYNEMPGYEIWFLAAKKQTALMGEIKDTYVRFTQIPFSEIQNIFEKEDIYMNNEDVDGYLSANLAISYVLQRKQLELDKEFHISTTNRYNVYQYYNLWSLSGLLGPLTWVNGDKVRVQNLMDKPYEYFEERGSIFYFMVKLVGWTKNVIGERIERLEKLFQQKEFTIEKFIESKPSRFECQETNFLVKGSVLYPIFEGSFYLKNETIKAISEEDNEKWVQYCSENYFDYEWKILPKIVNFFLMFSLDSLQIPWSRTHRTINFNKTYDLWTERLSDFLVEESTSIEFFLSVLANFTISFVLCLLIIQYVWRRKFKGDNENNENSFDSSEGEISVTEEEQRKINVVSERSKLFAKILLSVCLVLIWTIGLFIYFYIDFFGYRDDQIAILVGVIIVSVLQIFIEAQIKKFKELSIFYESSYLYLNYWMVYVCFSQTKKNKVWLVYCCFVTSLLGPIVLRICKRMGTRNFILKRFVNYSSKNVFRYILILFIGVFTMFPQIRYITLGEHYLVSYIPWVPTVIVGLLYVSALIECFYKQNNLELLRTIIIGLITTYLYFIIPLRNQVNGFNLQRIQWGFIVVAIYQTFAIEIDSNMLKYESNKNEGCENKQIKVFFCIYLIVFIEMLFGSFSHLERIFDYGRLIVIEHLLLVGNILLFTLYSKLKKDTVENKYTFGEHGFDSIQEVTEMESFE